MMMEMLKQILPSLLIILFFFVTLFAYTKLAGPIPFSVDSVTTNKSDLFTVSGEGKSSAKPDSAVVRVGVQATGQTAKTVQETMNTNINKVTDAIKKLGVADADIKTENYTVNPNIDYAQNQRITGYSANTTITVKMKEAEKANQVIDAGISNGATQIGGVTFEVADKAKAENEAREKAVTDAKKKAENASKVADFKLGRLVNYSEDNYQGDVARPYALESKDMAVSNPTNLEPGTNEIKITVYLSYEIK